MQIKAKRSPWAQPTSQIILAAAALLASAAAAGQAAPNMSFFSTSVGNGLAGGNYGGLDGADARCQSLAATAGAGSRVWRAYLSTAPIIGGGGGVLVHARDRIGTGPWHNYNGVEVAADLASLHANGIAPTLTLTELGTAVPQNEHDMLTGTRLDGSAFEEFPDNPTAPAPNCFNWTSNDPNAYGHVGHSDWVPGQSWNTVHPVLCDQVGLGTTGSSGRIYCFAESQGDLIFANGFEP